MPDESKLPNHVKKEAAIEGSKIRSNFTGGTPVPLLDYLIQLMNDAMDTEEALLDYNATHPTDTPNHFSNAFFKTKRDNINHWLTSPCRAAAVELAFLTKVYEQQLKQETIIIHPTAQDVEYIKKLQFDLALAMKAIEVFGQKHSESPELQQNCLTAIAACQTLQDNFPRVPSGLTTQLQPHFKRQHGL